MAPATSNSAGRSHQRTSLVMPIRTCAIAMLLVCVVSPPLVAGDGANPVWTDRRQVGPFVIQATFALAEYDALFSELPELQRELSQTLGIPRARQPIHVLLFSDADEFKAYKDRHFPKVPFRSALFIWEAGTPSVYAYRKPDMDVDLRHECTHALVHSVLADVPLWLDEGLAKYFEAPASKRRLAHPYFDDLRWKWSLRLGMIRTIDSLEERTDLTELDASDYRYSWAWVHFMLHGPQPAREILIQYLTACQKSANAGKLSRRLNESLPNSSQQLVQHFKRIGE